ncbi:transposase [Parapedobacter sp. DT-150]|uniref:transposase n=1 Tax=Parapedobacter sp. DT-150 TaxID=3396162 RepID=UPI003F194368
MKKIMFLAAASFLALHACNSGNGDVEEIEQLRNEAVAIHDEIMPQISAFDRNTLKIDSLLADLPRLHAAHPDLDTAHTRQELSALKTRLELATDSMMNWMTAFDVDPQDKSTAEIKAYYEQEVKKVKGMQELFNAVSKESTDRLAQF